MSEWKTIKLKDFVTLKRGYDLPHDKSREGNYPVIASTNIRSYHNEYKVDPPVVTVGRSGSIGKVQIVNKKAWPLNTTLYVKDSKGNNTNFIYYFLQTVGLEQFNSGAGVPTLNRNHIGLLKIKIPDIKKQEKIANFLSTYDKLIENNNRRIEVLEQTAEEIYKEWFVRMRFPGYEDTKFVKGIPEGWNSFNLEDVCELVRGISYRTKDIESNQGTSMMTLKSVKSYGGYNDDGIRYYDNEINARHILKENDVLMAITDMTQDKRVIGQVFLVPTLSDENMVYSADLILLDKLKIEAEYFYSMLRFGGLSNHIATYSNGANVLHLNQRTLNKIKFIVAPKKLREKYSNMFKYMQKEINILENNNKNLIKQRDLLLPRLMNGSIKVK